MNQQYWLRRPNSLDYMHRLPVSIVQIWKSFPSTKPSDWLFEAETCSNAEDTRSLSYLWKCFICISTHFLLECVGCVFLISFCFVLFTSVSILTITVILFKLNSAQWGEKEMLWVGRTVGLGGGGGDGVGRSLPWAWWHPQNEDAKGGRLLLLEGTCSSLLLCRERLCCFCSWCCLQKCWYCRLWSFVNECGYGCEHTHAQSWLLAWRAFVIKKG